MTTSLSKKLISPMFRLDNLLIHPRGGGLEHLVKNVGKISFLPSEVVKKENHSSFLCPQEQLRNLYFPNEALLGNYVVHCGKGLPYIIR